MSIEAMKLALEALEKCALMIEWEWGDCRFEEVMRETGEYTRETTPAITALRQAIEQAQKQEPVAWKDTTYGNLHHQDFGNSIPLYTSPPPRQPLTKETLEAMAEAHVTNCYFDTLKFARAIEVAHGIKGEA
jgi:hypothetical protein